MTWETLIHIGKCRAGTLREVVRQGGSDIDKTIHIRQPKSDDAAQYSIVARAPIARALSAFNWHHRPVSTAHRRRIALRANRPFLRTRQLFRACRAALLLRWP